MAREKWIIFYHDICIGLIGLRAGAPKHADQWEWKWGFHPGCDRLTGGPAGTFEQARAAVEADRQLLLPTLTERDFQAWRNQRDWTERKQAMWARGEKLPSQQPSTLMHPCGAMSDSHRPAQSTASASMPLRREMESADDEGRPLVLRPREAARRIIEHARAFEPIQEGRIYRKDKSSDDRR